MSLTSASWLRYLPAPLRARVEHRPNLQKILGNVGWLFGDKVLRMGVGLLVGVWVARYLGPEQFGLMSYAMAIVALVSSVGSLGLNGIVVRDLVKEPDTADVTLGTAFLLQIIGGFLAFALAMIAINIARPDDGLAKLMVALLSFAILFKATEVVKYWFESQVKSKYTIWVESGVFLVLATVKVGLILAQASLLDFVWAALAEAALVAVLLSLLYAKKVGKLPLRSASVLRAKILLMESWPLILVSVATLINMRMDQVMLGAMTNDLVVGNYSAAVRISEVWLMIPFILGASIFPAIIAAKEKDEAIYRKRILQISYYIAPAVLLAALVISVEANQIICLLYGKQYASAGGYLAILIWSGVPYLIFFVVNQMYYIERLLKIPFYVAVFTVISNISLNLILIPSYGGTGAALATLITSFASSALSLTILNFKTGIFWGASCEKIIP
jgi:O-antigen/teichoic acid export membrane protein